MKKKLLVTALVLPTLFWIKTAWLLGTQGPSIVHAPQATQATTIELANHLEQVTNGIFVQGSYAYVGEGVRLSILDISDPVSPTMVGQTPPLTSTAGFGFVEDIYVSGGRAYVATGYDGLRIVDTSVPTLPVEIGFYAATVHHVIVRDDYAYVSADADEFDEFASIHIIDISDPTHPVKVGSTGTGRFIHGIDVENDLVYASSTSVSGKGGVLYIMDASDPARPVGVGYWGSSAYLHGVEVVGDRAYVALGPAYIGWMGGLLVLDVSDPSDPVEAGAYIRDWPAYNLQAADGYVYLIGEYGLRLLDISDPANPVVVSFYNREWSPRWDNEYDLAVAGEYIYVAAEDEGLFILRRSDAAPSISVSINGPTRGLYDTAYRFTATVSPSTPLAPVTYTWAPAPDSGQGTDAATYTWPRWSTWYPTGDKTVSVMAVNVEGTAIDTHAITIYPAGVYLPIVVKIRE
jgi:hypothetical protein